MKPLFRRSVRLFAFVLTAFLTGAPQQLVAQEHVVSPEAMQQQLVDSAAQRSKNVDTLNQLLGSESAKKTLKGAGLSSDEVKTAVSQLSDEDLSKLATKANRAQHDFAAGALTNQQLTYIIIALATAVIIIIILKA